MDNNNPLYINNNNNPLYSNNINNKTTLYYNPNNNTNSNKSK